MVVIIIIIIIIATSTVMTMITKLLSAIWKKPTISAVPEFPLNKK